MRAGCDVDFTGGHDIYGQRRGVLRAPADGSCKTPSIADVGPRARAARPYNESSQNGFGSAKRRSTFSVIRETLLSYLLCERLPIQAIDPVVKTAPPPGIS